MGGGRWWGRGRYQCFRLITWKRNCIEFMNAQRASSLLLMKDHVILICRLRNVKTILNGRSDHQNEGTNRHVHSCTKGESERALDQSNNPPQTIQEQTLLYDTTPSQQDSLTKQPKKYVFTQHSHYPKNVYIQEGDGLPRGFNTLISQRSEAV